MLEIIVLGIMEGFTEWLPISSTGHMTLVDEIIRLNQSDAFKDVFLVVIRLGAILAVVVMYFYKLNPFSPTKTNRQKNTTRVLWIKIITACAPTAILGLLPDDWMEAHLFNAYVVAVALIVYGVLFIVFESSSVCTNPGLTKTGQTSAKTALLTDIVQLLTLILGTSHSGSTILGTMVLSCSRAAVIEFSFLPGVPVMFGASLLKIVKYFLAGSASTGPQIFYTILGTLITFAVPIYSVRFLMNYVCKHDFKLFRYYRIILGMIVLAHFGITALVSQERKPEAQS